ncbi:L-ribulose-5-phosphate 4-epimerase [Christensenella tenuis]|jgi:L-ribulose-5-phosphate 4-epimerase|uniref:L-ribulose-5-phosphate 4-epimerase n=1 Tax=Christensenella tenuis TaxID=2763033 RepID=A0ABR7EDS9_9FIRM|nr:L-ribulose-5-phosphate 4-epimerase [Christensenella tenuis]MBC5647932.1 L-ribulose-5-phosphate 4-epimerase [Christensenella tenuis]
MKDELKRRVYEANMLLPKYGLITFTWGNVSEREGDVVAIKPSGVEYGALRPEDIVLVDMDGNTLESGLKPSSDLETHLELYRNFEGVMGITHTHSEWATSWAQAGMDIPAAGTTHADYIYGDVPCTRGLTPGEIRDAYEHNTGKVIVETFAGLDPLAVPCVLVKNHGPFTWGTDAAESVHNAVVLEQVAKMAFIGRALQGGGPQRMPQNLLDKHYLRKHGKNAYYGQKK